MKEQLSKLESLIPQYRDRYYNGIPEVSDSEYDAMIDQLRAIKPDHSMLIQVGSPIPTNSPWEKVDHDKFMGSQAKVTNEEDFMRWVDKIKSSNPKAKMQFCVDAKLDGIDLSLQYRDGKLVHAVTRGDGSQGEDILRNTVKMRGVPSSIDVHGDFTVRGQMMISKSTFAKMKKYGLPYKNTRNACGGIARRLDGDQSRLVDFIAFDCFGGLYDDIKTDMRKATRLDNDGFIIVARTYCEDPSSVVASFKHWDDSNRSEYDYDIDGLVVRLDNIEDQELLGESGGCPVSQIAWKFESETGTTKVVDIIWQPSISSNSGRITPVAVLEPIDVLGVTITNVTLNNEEFFTALGVSIGSTVKIARANDVIPQVVAVLEPGNGEINKPIHCRTCNAVTENRNKDIVCPNPDCMDKVVARIQCWVVTTNMLGVGDKVVKSLVESGLVGEPADLYKLTAHEVMTLERMGEKSSQKIVDAIQSRKVLTIPIFMAALGMNDIGESVTMLLIAAGLNTLTKIRSAGPEELMAIKGIGPATCNSLINGMKLYEAEIDNAINEHVSIVEPREGGKLSDMSFCFTGAVATINPDTGKRYKRNELQDMAVNEGGTVKDSVGAGLTYLVQADADSTSSKSEKAKKLGTEVISDIEFLKMTS